MLKWIYRKIAIWSSVCSLFIPSSSFARSEPKAETFPTKAKTIQEPVNQILDRNLLDGILRFKSRRAIGLIMDVNNGEVVALSYITKETPSLVSRKDEIENTSKFRFRDGSVLKLLTIAKALDNHSVRPSDRFHVPKSISAGPFILHDRNSGGQSSNIEDIFIYSSNVGTAMLAKLAGWRNERAFLKTLFENSFSNDVSTLSEPMLYVEDETSTLLASIGHNVFASPFHYVSAIASLVNGGFLVDPTFLKGDLSRRQKVLRDEKTSIEVRKLLQKEFQILPIRSETREDWIGGFSHTAEKMLDEDESSENHLVTSFVGVAPVEVPKYIYLTVFDDPISHIETGGPVSAGENAAPVTRKIIRETESLLKLR